MAADSTTAPNDPLILAANQATAQANALKAEADAKTAAIGAQAAATQAKAGTVPDSGFTGKVDVAADAGKAEATLLAARTIDLAASVIADEIASLVSNRVVRIYAGSDRPILDHWFAFKLRLTLLSSAMTPKARDLDNDAVAALGKIGLAQKPHAKLQIAPALAIGLGVSTIAKLGALFQSDYTVGGVALTPDDVLLATSVASRLTSPKTIFSWATRARAARMKALSTS
jgi:hypothetical protein